MASAMLCAWLTKENQREDQRISHLVSGIARMSAFCAVNGKQNAYTKQEYARHLAGMANALSKQGNFHVILLQTPFLHSNMALCHKKGAGTILARTDDYRIVFAINEPTMTAAFGEYLVRQAAEAGKASYRNNMIKRLYTAAKLPRT